LGAKLTRLTHKSDTTAPSVRDMYHLQFSLQAASPELLDTLSYMVELGSDCLFRLYLVLDSLTSKFQGAYTYEQELIIDEAVCAFQGHIFCSMYMKGKLCKCRFEIFYP